MIQISNQNIKNKISLTVKNSVINTLLFFTLFILIWATLAIFSFKCSNSESSAHSISNYSMEYVSNISFVILGIGAYFAPIICIIFYFHILFYYFFSSKYDKSLSFSMIKVFGKVTMLILSISGLGSIDINNVCTSTGGGVIGKLIFNKLNSIFSNIFISHTILLFMFFINLFSLTRYSLIDISERIGHYLLKLNRLKTNINQSSMNRKNSRFIKWESIPTLKKQKIKISPMPESLLLGLEKVTSCEKSIYQIRTIKSSFCNSTTKLLSKPVTYQKKLSLPPVELLDTALKDINKQDHKILKRRAILVKKRLLDFSIEVDIVNFLVGPVVTRFELRLAPGTKASSISRLSQDIARALSVNSVRVIEIIPGKPYVGIEIPNKYKNTVHLGELLKSVAFQENSSPVTIAIGKDATGFPVIANLQEMPHLLIAGTTGSGKSVGLHTIIISILYKSYPKDVRLILIDPKVLEFAIYEKIPHLITDVITDKENFIKVLSWSINEMERRYQIMSRLGVRDLFSYNKKIQKIRESKKSPLNNSLSTEEINNSTLLKKIPYIIILIDELADLKLMLGKKFEELILRLVQKSRAAGIHLILSTQRPSVDIITGSIKANFPTRIAFTVSSSIDSRTIINQNGAEALLGRGDMLYLNPYHNSAVRVHGAFISEEEIKSVVQHWKNIGLDKE